MNSQDLKTLKKAYQIILKLKDEKDDTFRIYSYDALKAYFKALFEHIGN